MPIMFIAVSHGSVANALDFRMFKLAPFAVSYVRMASRNAAMSAGFVTNCYVIGIGHHRSFHSSTNCVFRHKANSNMLIDQPCRTEQRIWIGLVVCPLMWIEENALSNIFSMRAMNFVLKPYSVSNIERYLSAILPNVFVKSNELMHCRTCDTSAYGIAFPFVATASKIPRADAPYC
jgi:hypothetical protein